MAILRGDNFDIEFSYKTLSEFHSVEYVVTPLLNDVPMFNPALLNPIDKGFLFDFKEELKDVVFNFFSSIVNDKKGDKIGINDYFDFSIEAITWSDTKDAKMKEWENRTISCYDSEKQERKDRKYSDLVNGFFLPLIENRVEINLYVGGTGFKNGDLRLGIRLCMTTSLDKIAEFVAELKEEHDDFYSLYLGDLN